VGRYLMQRLIEGLITLWLITLVVFFLLRLGGSNPVEYMLPPDASRADIEKLTRAYGFDQPLLQQYWLFNWKLLRGDVDVVRARVPATLQLTSAAMLFALILGVSLGALSAARPESLLDRVGRVLAIAGQSMPVFWVGLLLILLFSVYLKWLPSAGGIDRVGLQGLIMPALSLSFFLVASHMRIVRSTMLDVLHSDYIKMGRVKGLPERLVIWKHAFTNAAIPVVTLFFVNFTALISGAVVTETIFAWPGMGRLLVDSLLLRDYPTTQTVIFFAAACIVCVNIAVDLLYAWLDPRIRVA
jgi:peptide/nickel transport system permease protein